MSPDVLVVVLVLVAVLGGAALVYRWGAERDAEIRASLEPDEHGDRDGPDRPGDLAAELGVPLAADEPPLPDIGAAPGAPPSGRPVAERLAEIDDLLARGVITPAQHHERRRDILRST